MPDKGETGHYMKGTNLMTAQPITAAPTLVPATITSGFATGKTTDKILVDPATGTHYCPDCTFTADSFASLRGHRGAHSTVQRKTRSDKATAVPDLGARIDQIGQLLNEVRAEFVDISDDKVDASWKQRAQAAERRLSTLRRALGTDAT